MLQSTLFPVACVQSADGIRELHNTKIHVRSYGKYGQPEKTLKCAAENLAGLVASGDIEHNQAEVCLQECYEGISHLCLRPVDLVKMLKTAFRTVKRNFKAKIEAAKAAIVESIKKSATTISRFYKIIQIEQGLLFGMPTQRLDNRREEQHIKGCWYLDLRGFAVLGEIVVGV